MLNVIILLTLLVLLIIPTFKEYEDWSSFTKNYFGITLLLFIGFFLKFFFFS